jgi:hypothetical protein
MSIKKFKFYQYSISIKEDENFSSLDDIEDEDTEPTIIQGEVIKVDSFRVKRFSDRFCGINVESGDLNHYSDTIVDTKDNLRVKGNPRKNTQIELHDQFLLLIDTNEKKVYLSNSKKKSFAQKLLTDRTRKNVVIKEILNKELFEKNLKTISEVNFLFSDLTLFNQTELNIALNDDIHNYDADSVRVIFKYRQKNISGKIKRVISKLIKNKDDYQIKIVGKDEKGLESIFKPDSILSYLNIEATYKNNTRGVDYISVFSELIIKIKENA